MGKAGLAMAGELLLTLKEIPSFEGELSVRLMEEHDSEGRANYSLVCEKKPPLDREEWPLIVGVAAAFLEMSLASKKSPRASAGSKIFLQ